jgi:hypothetical protein
LNVQIPTSTSHPFFPGTGFQGITVAQDVGYIIGATSSSFRRVEVGLDLRRPGLTELWYYAPSLLAVILLPVARGLLH